MQSISQIFAVTAPGASEPAGGAALDQVAIATGMASVATAVLIFGIFGYRNGKGGPLRRLAAFSERVSGLPAWAALPAGLAGGSLLVALLGMYWDISLHIDQGRDPGPLANPAHYLILVGLYGVFAAGCLALALPEEKPGDAAIRITRDWYVPVGGVLTAACGGFALLGFPLDDVWHRLFGQDVTLWGPTHLMLFGGAGLSLIGQAILLAEGMRFRAQASADRLRGPQLLVALRRVGLMGGLLIGLSTFQGEFDFGVPQFRMVFHPMLIALSAGMALTAGRIWIGRGGALATALMFVVVRGAISLIVGDVFGETMPAIPLYLAEAFCIEAVALLTGRNRPIALGAAGGFLCGTVGLAAEWAWVGAVFPLPWSKGIVPEAFVVAPIAGIAGGLIGGLLGSGLRFSLPAPRVARTAALGAFAAIAGLTAYGLATVTPPHVTATASLQDAPGSTPQHREVTGTVRLSPSNVADDSAWVTVTSWQDGGLKVDRLQRVGEGVYRFRQPAPAYGDWKTILRVQTGRAIMGVPVYMPADTAIPAKEVPASAHFTRPFVADHLLLQRERKGDVPGWLWTAACLLVLALSLMFMASLAWGVARVARTPGPGAPPAGPDAARTAPREERDGRFGRVPAPRPTA
jgi:hypothetical protein